MGIEERCDTHNFNSLAADSNKALAAEACARNNFLADTLSGASNIVSEGLTSLAKFKPDILTLAAAAGALTAATAWFIQRGGSKQLATSSLTDSFSGRLGQSSAVPNSNWADNISMMSASSSRPSQIRGVDLISKANGSSHPKELLQGEPISIMYGAGGVNGAAHPGFKAALEDTYGLSERANNWYGSSIGAMAATFHANGYSSERMAQGLQSFMDSRINFAKHWNQNLLDYNLWKRSVQDIFEPKFWLPSLEELFHPNPFKRMDSLMDRYTRIASLPSRLHKDGILRGELMDVEKLFQDFMIGKQAPGRDLLPVPGLRIIAYARNGELNGRRLNQDYFSQLPEQGKNIPGKFVVFEHPDSIAKTKLHNDVIRIPMQTKEELANALAASSSFTGAGLIGPVKRQFGHFTLELEDAGLFDRHPSWIANPKEKIVVGKLIEATPRLADESWALNSTQTGNNVFGVTLRPQEKQQIWDIFRELPEREAEIMRFRAYDRTKSALEAAARKHSWLKQTKAPELVN